MKTSADYRFYLAYERLGYLQINNDIFEKKILEFNNILHTLFEPFPFIAIYYYKDGEGKRTLIDPDVFSNTYSFLRHDGEDRYNYLPLDDLKKKFIDFDPGDRDIYKDAKQCIAQIFNNNLRRIIDLRSSEPILSIFPKITGDMINLEKDIGIGKYFDWKDQKEYSLYLSISYPEIRGLTDDEVQAWQKLRDEFFKEENLSIKSKCLRNKENESCSKKKDLIKNNKGDTDCVQKFTFNKEANVDKKNVDTNSLSFENFSYSIKRLEEKIKNQVGNLNCISIDYLYPVACFKLEKDDKSKVPDYLTMLLDQEKDKPELEQIYYRYFPQEQKNKLLDIGNFHNKSEVYFTNKEIGLSKDEFDCLWDKLLDHLCNMSIHPGRDGIIGHVVKSKLPEITFDSLNPGKRDPRINRYMEEKKDKEMGDTQFEKDVKNIINDFKHKDGHLSLWDKVKKITRFDENKYLDIYEKLVETPVFPSKREITNYFSIPIIFHNVYWGAFIGIFNLKDNFWELDLINKKTLLLRFYNILYQSIAGIENDLGNAFLSDFLQSAQDWLGSVDTIEKWSKAVEDIRINSRLNSFLPKIKIGKIDSIDDYKKLQRREQNMGQKNFDLQFSTFKEEGKDYPYLYIEYSSRYCDQRFNIQIANFKNVFFNSINNSITSGKILEKRGKMSGESERAIISGHEAGGQLQTVQKLLSGLDHEEFRNTTKDLILGAINYIDLFLAEGSSSQFVCDWDIREGEDVEKWLKRIAIVAWKVALSREIRKVSVDKPLLKKLKTLLTFKLKIDYNSDLTYWPSDSVRDAFRLLPTNLSKWILAGLSNAIKWSGTTEENENKRIEDWYEKKSKVFKSITIDILRVGEDRTKITILNGYHISKESYKASGTRRVLEFINERLPVEKGSFKFKSLNEENEKTWETSIILEKEIFV